MQDSLGSQPDAPSSISVREYLDILRRRRAIIIQTSAIVLVIGVLVNIYTAPTYKANARLLLAPPAFSINTVNTSDPLADVFQNNQQYSTMTQVQMLQAGDLRGRVAEKIGAKGGLPAMTVTPVEGTQIIDVAAEGDDPSLVSQAPNQLLDFYIADQNAKSRANLDRAIRNATSLTAKFTKKLDDLDVAIRKFKNDHDVTQLDKNQENQMGLVQNIAQAIFQANAEWRTLQTQRSATLDEMAKMGATTNAALSELTDPAIQGIESQLVGMEVQRKAAEQQYPPGSIALLTIDVQMARLQQRKDELTKNFVARNQVRNPLYQAFSDKLVGMSIEAVTLAQKRKDLADQYAIAKKRLDEFPAWEKEWNRLQREYQQASASLTNFAANAGNLEIRTGYQKPGPSVMQYAVTPKAPISPNKPRNILFAGLLGIFLGLCLALLQELFDDRINSPEEAERALRVPNLGLIPLIEESGLRLIRDTSSYSPLMESYRTLRTNINFAAVGRPVRSLVVTSAIAAEGKSTTVANLAMAMAMDNKRVIIVDADLRRPSLHKLFKLDSSPGLTDLLIETHTLDQVIRTTPVKNISVITAGSPPPNPAELLGSSAMGQLLAELEAYADIVLFDSPPVLLVTDSVVLASRTNGVLLVVGFGETKKASTKKALEVLGRANANVLGTVLNRLEGPSGSYYYYAGKYYAPVSDKAKSGGSGNGGSGGGPNVAAPPEAVAALPQGDAGTAVTDKKES